MDVTFAAHLSLVVTTAVAAAAASCTLQVRLVRRALDLAKLQPGDRVLDVACGRGKSSHMAAQRVGDSGRVLGLDLLPQVSSLTHSVLQRYAVLPFHHGHVWAPRLFNTNGQVQLPHNHLHPPPPLACTCRCQPITTTSPNTPTECKHGVLAVRRQQQQPAVRGRQRTQPAHTPGHARALPKRHCLPRGRFPL